MTTDSAPSRSARPVPTALPLTVSRIRHEFEEVYSYFLRSPDPVPFEAGQYLHLVAPGEAVSKATVRHMSVASAPDEEELLFTMGLESDSRFKRCFRGLREGDALGWFGVSGEFTLRGLAPEVPVVFVAGGIGVTPFRSLIRDIERRGGARPWSLLHVARGAHLYEADFTEYDRPQIRTNRAGVPKAVKEMVAANPEAVYYVSGSGRFVKGLTDRLAAHGISLGHIRIENFDH